MTHAMQHHGAVGNRNRVETPHLDDPATGARVPLSGENAGHDEEGQEK
jgi:hypothetical protein